MASTINPPYPKFKDQLRSKTVRTAIQEIRDGHNELVNEFNTAVSSTASEVTNARDNFTTLQENVRARRFLSGVLTGGDVTGSGTAKVAYTAGEGVCGNGAGIEWTAGDSPTFATATNRWDVLVVNSDNSISIVQGTDTAGDIIPSVSNTKRPLALVHITDTSGPTIAQADILDARQQGAYANNKWYWDPQDAIDSLSNTTGGHVLTRTGNYYQEIDLSGKNNLTYESEGGVTYYRPDDTSYAMKSINATGSETNQLRIYGGRLDGNGKAGSNELLNMEFTDNFQITDISFGVNSTSSATYESALFNSCDAFLVRGTDDGDSRLNVGVSNSSAYDVKVVGTYWFELKPTDSIQGTAVSAGDVFTALSPFVPNVGDSIVVSGGVFTNYSGQNALGTWSRATRSAATDIEMDEVVMNHQGTGTYRVITIVSGGAGTLNIALAW